MKAKKPRTKRGWVQALRIKPCMAPTRAKLPEFTVDSPSAACEIALKIVTNQPKTFPLSEHFLILFLNARNRFLGYYLSEGTVDRASVYPAEVVRRVLLTPGTVSVVIVHNHPSGNPKPSPQDIALTRTLVEALALVDVNVHDHIVFAVDRQGRMDFSSLQALGLMPTRPGPLPLAFGEQP